MISPPVIRRGDFFIVKVDARKIFLPIAFPWEKGGPAKLGQMRGAIQYPTQQKNQKPLSGCIILCLVPLGEKLSPKGTDKGGDCVPNVAIEIS